VVTGAASGIGRALARLLHARGNHVALVDMDVAGLEKLAAELPGASAHACDVSILESVERTRDDILARRGDVHLLVNNAGVSAAGPVDQVPLVEFHRAMDVNFWGMVHMCRAFLPALRNASASGVRPAICNVLSDFALFSLPTKSPYAASKHAARALTESLAAELYGTGISVTAIYPGATATDIVWRGYAVDPSKKAVEASFLAKGLPPEVVAKRILRGVDARRSRVRIGRDTYAIDWSVRLAPGLVQGAVRRLWRRVPFL
jgi:short-subunit dehydrogenase